MNRPSGKFTSGELSGLSPGEVLQARAAAFERGDYGLIFDSYHADSMFRQQFPDRNAYLAYGREQLTGEYRIHACRVLQEVVEGSCARVISLLEFERSGTRLQLLELTWMLPVGRSWRVHSAQKQAPGDFACPPEEVGFEDFARITDAVIF